MRAYQFEMEHIQSCLNKNNQGNFQLSEADRHDFKGILHLCIS